MSKSRNRKWYEFDDEYNDYNKKKKSRKDERRNQKKMKNAMKSRNLDSYDYEEDNR